LLGGFSVNHAVHKQTLGLRLIRINLIAKIII
jgi:hypothetical protein